MAIKSQQKLAEPTQRITPSKPIMPKKFKTESISDDDRSEKRYSSSHDEKDIKTIRTRKDEDRRKKRSVFKIETDTKPHKILPAHTQKVFPSTKKLSPDDTKIIGGPEEGTSPTKQRRFRSKQRKNHRNRSTSGEDSLPRRTKPTNLKSPDTATKAPLTTTKAPSATGHTVTTKLSPPKGHVCQKEALKSKKLSPNKRLQAISTESLRSVSPGSDSVFYSEIDPSSDHQVRILFIII